MSLRTPADFSPKLRNRIKERLNDVRTKLTGVVTSQWAINELFAPEEENIARKYAEIEGAKLHRAWIEERSRSGKMEKDDDKRLFLPHAIDIFCHVRQVDPVVAVLDLGCRRELISIEQYHRLRRKLGIDETDYGIDLLRAIEVADLVVDEYRCLGIWKGEEFEFDPQNREGAYFLKLVCRAASGRALEPNDFTHLTGREHLGDWKCRLGKVKGFPNELHGKIYVTGDLHRLRVPPHRIRVLRAAPAGTPT